MSLILLGKQAILRQASDETATSEDHYSLVLDISKCIRCHKCEIDCKLENLVPEGVRILRMVALGPEEWDGELRIFNVRASCFQCHLPACVSACPTGALRKSPEGVVIRDEALCVGCRICELTCPNCGTLSYDKRTKQMLKCDFCLKRLDNGLLPACVEGCLMGALAIKKGKDLVSFIDEKKAGASPVMLNIR
ncbi:MAG: 4Fe-4S ferredoxin [Nitrospirae bacterium]|nr:4Fe-4S ferredoxin [Nitrospirota bacterium]